MPRNGTDCKSCRLVRLSLLLVLGSLAGCSPSAPDAGEPSPREVRRHLARRLKEGEAALRLTEFHQEREGRYSGEAIGPKGMIYRITATTEGRTLKYQAEPDQL